MTNNPAVQEKYFRRQAFYWLVFAGVIVAVWLLIWLFANAPKVMTQDAPKKADEVKALPSSIDVLNELDEEVPPIDFSTLVRDLRTYPKEFKDKHYFAKNSHTLQIMDVSENDIIVNYLNARPSDRDKFAYFRYLDKDKKARYILTYGKFGTQQEAQKALSVDFGLPNNQKPIIKQTKAYLDIIDQYERGAVVHDGSTRQPRQIKLQATRSEIPVQAATQKDTQLSQKSQAQAKSSQARVQAQAQAQARSQEQASSSAPKAPAQEQPKPKPVMEETHSVAEPTPPTVHQPQPSAPPAPKPDVPKPNTNTPSLPGAE